MEKILICFAMLGALAGCGGGGGREDGKTVIFYNVSGSAPSATVTYQNSQGGTSQATVKTPWTTQLYVSDGDFLYVSAQNNGQYGSIDAEIFIGDKSFKKGTSSVGYGIATASGKCC